MEAVITPDQSGVNYHAARQSGSEIWSSAGSRRARTSDRAQRLLNLSLRRLFTRAGTIPLISPPKEATSLIILELM